MLRQGEFPAVRRRHDQALLIPADIGALAELPGKAVVPLKLVQQRPQPLCVAVVILRLPQPLHLVQKLSGLLRVVYGLVRPGHGAPDGNDQLRPPGIQLLQHLAAVHIRQLLRLKFVIEGRVLLRHALHAAVREIYIGSPYLLPMSAEAVQHPVPPQVVVGGLRIPEEHR